LRWWRGRIGRRRGKAVEWYERRESWGEFWNIQDARQKRTKEEKAEKKIKIIKRMIDYYYHFMIETSTRTVVRWVFWVGLNLQFEKEGGGKVVDVLVEKRQIRAKKMKSTQASQPSPKNGPIWAV
jgi:hypothetical protein